MQESRRRDEKKPNLLARTAQEAYKHTSNANAFRTWQNFTDFIVVGMFSTIISEKKVLLMNNIEAMWWAAAEAESTDFPFAFHLSVYLRQKIDLLL